MLANISVNSLSHNDLEAKHRSRKKLGSIINYMHREQSHSVFLNNVRIILPVKEYSNKFLRECRPREDIINNHCVFRPKKSMVCVRNQLKYRKNKHKRTSKYRDKQVLHHKTECSDTNSATCNCERQNIKDQLERMVQTPVEKSASVRNKMERISTSRALGLFSKVFKNQNVDRMIVRKEAVNKTADVHVKQLTLQDKQKVQKKSKLTLGTAYGSLSAGGINKKIAIHGPYSCIYKPVKNKLLFLEDENFQLVGW